MSESANGVDQQADDEFERLGRQAGAELRTPPPGDGPGIVKRTATRRRTRMVAGVAGATVALIVAGFVVQHDAPRDGKERTVTSAPTATATTADPSATSVPPDAGAWREVPSSPFAPELVTAAVWTGEEVIVLGDDGDQLAAAAYEPTGDRWRDVADPPAALAVFGPALTPRWTGSEVLAATGDGHVFAYDPGEDQWTARVEPDESMALASGPLLAVSSRGVLARSSTGWWWYDDATDRWDELTAPALDATKTTLAALDEHRMVATEIDGATLTSSVLDIQTRTWADGPSVQGPANPREMDCSPANGLLVCLAEGYGSAAGEVIDPLVGSVGTFALGNHTDTISAYGTPWFAHAGKILLARPDPAWEDLPPQGAGGSFGAAVWTGTEIVFFGSDLGSTAAYTPRSVPRRGPPQ